MIRDTKRRTAERLALARARRRRGSAGVSANLLPWLFAGGLPSIASLSYGLGDTLGGGNSIVITGTNVNGATSVMFGAASATITGNTDTTVTVTLPPASGGANAFGNVNVTVTTPRGTSNALNWEYWNPTAEGEGPSLFVERIVDANQTQGYSITTGTGNWRTRSAGIAMSEATNEPSDITGYPSFNGSNRLLTSNNIGVIGDMGSTAAISGCFVLDIGTAAAPAGTWEGSAGLWADAGRGAVGASITTSGFTQWAALSGGTASATMACSTTGWHSCVGVMDEGVGLKASVDGATFNSTANANNYPESSAENLNIGANYNQAANFNGALRVVLFYAHAVNQAFVTKFHTWANQRHIF